MIMVFLKGPEGISKVGTRFFSLQKLESAHWAGNYNTKSNTTEIWAKVKMGNGICAKCGPINGYK